LVEIITVSTEEMEEAADGYNLMGCNHIMAFKASVSSKKMPILNACMPLPLVFNAIKLSQLQRIYWLIQFHEELYQ